VSHHAHQHAVLILRPRACDRSLQLPGTYEKTDIIHPQQAEVAATQITLGTKTYGAALPWAPTTVTRALDPSTLPRASFFHHSRARPCTGTSRRS